MEVNLTLISACMMATLDSGRMHHNLGGEDQYNMYSGPEISARISRIDDSNVTL